MDPARHHAHRFLLALKRVLPVGNGQSLGLITGATGTATLLSLLDNSDTVLMLSCALFGSTFLVVVALTTNIIRLAQALEAWAAWIGYFTMVFGLGQVIGPDRGGWAGDLLGPSAGVS